MSQEIKKGKFFYAVEFKGGVVKVGVGKSVEDRVSSHKMTASLMGAGDVNEVFFVYCGLGYANVERDAINYFLTKFKKIGNSREWFKGEITEDFKEFINDRTALHKNTVKINRNSDSHIASELYKFWEPNFQRIYAEHVAIAVKFEEFIIDSGLYIPHFDSCDGEFSPFVQIMAFVFHHDKSKVFEYTAEIIVGEITPEAVLMVLDFAGQFVNEKLHSEGAI